MVVRLTAHGEAILAAVRRWQETHPYPPSHRELMEETGIATTSTVAYQLRFLRAAGLVDFVDNETRTVHIPGSTYRLPKRSKGVG